MAKTGLAQTLESARPLILWAELAGLLHDVGKLSNAFYDYRRKWRTLDDGWNRDPHDHKFLEKKDNLIKGDEFEDLRGCFRRPLLPLPDTTKNSFPHAAEIIKCFFPDADKCSIATLVDNHIKPEDSLTRLLQAADGKDAALDRNNPLFTADQTGETIFDTDVFGAESETRKFNITSFDEKRKKLYGKLNSLLPQTFLAIHWNCGKRS